MTDLISYPPGQVQEVCVWCGNVQQSGCLPSQKVLCPSCRPDYLAARGDEEYPYFVSEAAVEIRDPVEYLREKGFKHSEIPFALKDKEGWRE